MEQIRVILGNIKIALLFFFIPQMNKNIFRVPSNTNSNGLSNQGNNPITNICTNS